MSERVEGFSRALAGLIERREREFSKAFADHVGKFSLAGRSGSGMDAFGRLEVARSAYKGGITEAMENALKFSRVEGVSVSRLLMAIRVLMIAFGERIADTAKFTASQRKK